MKELCIERICTMTSYMTTAKLELSETLSYLDILCDVCGEKIPLPTFFEIVCNFSEDFESCSDESCHHIIIKAR